MFSDVDCGALNVLNGTVDTTSGTFLTSTAHYSCDAGFWLNGSDFRVCQEDGTWNYSDPICVIQGNL